MFIRLLIRVGLGTEWKIQRQVEFHKKQKQTWIRVRNNTLNSAQQVFFFPSLSL